jgi:hypothetical protein
MTLTEKLQKIKNAKNLHDEDPVHQRKVWQLEIEKIYAEIKLWFSSYIDSGLFNVIEPPKNIEEEALGIYTVNVLELEFGNLRLVFEPIARNIFGYNGLMYVYIRGNKSDRYQLLLQETDNDTQKWILSSFKDRSIRFDFNKANMERLLEQWIDQYTTA